MKKIILVFLTIYAVANQSFAQDFNFSQFYTSPMTLNPALTGAFPGKYRLAGIHKSQWAQVSPVPISTSSVGIDLRFELDQSRKAKDVVSVGMAFAHDQTSVFQFNTNQIMLSGAFTKALTNDNTQQLTGGVQIGVGQRALSFDRLDFPTEFNGFSAFNNPSFENLPNNNIAYFDVSSGLNWVISPRRGVYYHIGAAVHHLTEPNISFFEVDKGGTNKLQRKYTAHANMNFPLNARTQISPRAMIQFQGAHAQLNAGTNFRLQFNDYGTTAMHVGGWARAVRNTPTKIGFDSAVAMVGFEFSNFLLGLSYDVNLKSVASYGGNQGGFEISIGYLGDYDNDTILCPKF
jgi:type IX secretion system PorP/SprF family membrane protein